MHLWLYNLPWFSTAYANTNGTAQCPQYVLYCTCTWHCIPFLFLPSLAVSFWPLPFLPSSLSHLLTPPLSPCLSVTFWPLPSLPVSQSPSDPSPLSLSLSLLLTPPFSPCLSVSCSFFPAIIYVHQFRIYYCRVSNQWSDTMYCRTPV